MGVADRLLLSCEDIYTYPLMYVIPGQPHKLYDLHNGTPSAIENVVQSAGRDESNRSAVATYTTAVTSVHCRCDAWCGQVDCSFP